MSSPFTTITPQNMFDIEIWNEIRRAISERQNNWSPTLFKSGDCGYLSVLNWQNTLEGLLSSFASDVYDSGGTTDEFEFWTLEKLKDGPLNHGGGNGGQGWRRQVTFGEWAEAGKRQTGDIVGPWILEDLQAVLSALKWRVFNAYYVGETKGGQAFDVDGDEHMTLGSATSEATSNYNSATPSGSSLSPRALGQVSENQKQIMGEWETIYWAGFESTKSSIRTTLPTGQNDWDVAGKLYARAVKQNSAHDFEEQSPLEENKYVELFSDDYTSGSDRVVSFGDFTSEWAAPFYPSSTDPSGLTVSKSWVINDAKALISYDYTNS